MKDKIAGLENTRTNHFACSYYLMQKQSHTKQCVLVPEIDKKQVGRAVARKSHDAAGVLFGLKLADNINYKLKSSQASTARLQSSKHTGAKQNLMQNGHSRSRLLESVESR